MSRVIYVDVDDTLVRSAGSKQIPMSRVIDAVRHLHAAGETLYIWSRGGADYARATAQGLGLEACFAAFLPKPEVYLDDQSIQQWSGFRHVHPNQVDTLLSPGGSD